MATKTKQIDKNDISKNIFSDVLQKALSSCDGSMMALSVKLGRKSRIDNWFKGHMPPYSVMQESYYELLKIAESKGE